MSDWHDEEELAPLEEQRPLLIAQDGGVSPGDSWLTLLALPVGIESDGRWDGDWSSVHQQMQKGRSVALECLHADGSRALLQRRSVTRLLEQADLGRLPVQAIILERCDARDVLAADGHWCANRLACWGEWASALPDGVVPLVALDLAELSAPAALHLLASATPSGLVLAVRAVPELLAADVEWTLVGWEATTQRGTLRTKADSSPELQMPDRKQVGLVLPADRCRTEADCEELLRAMETCRERGWSMRLLSEEQIHQCWHGLEALVVLGDRLSGKGRRQLAGFYAAGGSLLWLRVPTGMVDEVEFAHCLEFPVLE
jgi:hypothetical protein